jgi:hypothetical protein
LLWDLRIGNHARLVQLLELEGLGLRLEVLLGVLTHRLEVVLEILVLQTQKKRTKHQQKKKTGKKKWMIRDGYESFRQYS